MAKVRGAMMSLVLIFGTAYGHSAQAAAAAGTSNPPAASPQGHGGLTITLRMYNYGVARSTLVQAEGKATAILNQVGLEVSWVDCPATPAEFKSYPGCQGSLGTTDFAVKILTADEAELFLSHHEALGRALPCATDQAGCTAYIFYRNVLEVAGDGVADKSQVLGHAMVHEIGHLLLGPNSHTANGIMRGRWNKQDLQTIATRHLAFSEQQSEHIRAEIRERSAVQQAQLGNPPVQ
jgi:hypothetical protein